VADGHGVEVVRRHVDAASGELRQSSPGEAAGVGRCDGML
jgi:hypothetical protein